MIYRRCPVRDRKVTVDHDPKVYHDSLRHDALLLFQETGVITRDTAVGAIRDEQRENRHWAEVRFADQKVLSQHMTRES
jgi:hypothetical protein